MEWIRPKGKINRLSLERMKQLAEQVYLSKLPNDELQDLVYLSDELLDQFDRIDEMAEPSLPVEFPDREEIHQPTREEDPYNMFITKCLVKGSPTGPLKGKKVGIKDNISVRGIPMTNASRVCEGYVPNLDATIVLRILRAGADIVGKLNMDDMSFSGTSESSFFGAVRNPMKPDYSPGGSSSGAGAAVANGDIDIAIAVDQGGSARCPAAWTGVTSIKATHGLVPSFGLSYMDQTLDYICPVTKKVSELAEALEVIAGEDENDPQWVRGPIKVDKYSRHLGRDVRGLKIALIKESLEWTVSENDVNDATRNALSKLTELGAIVDEISVPIFKDSPSIWTAVLVPAFAATAESDGDGYGHGGYHNTHWNEFFGRARRTKSSAFPPLVKLSLLVAKYLHEDYFGVHYSKAQNLRRLLTKELDDWLDKYDLLALPTTPMKPTKLRNSISFSQMARTGTFVINNTCAFNLTGHPAISIPCAIRDGLPIGLQLVAKHFDEGTLFRTGYAFEQAFDWRKI